MIKIKDLWREVENKYIGTKKYFFLSPSHCSIYFDSLDFFEKYIKGFTLDLGAGRLGWKFLITKFCLKYFSFDLKLENKELSFISNGNAISLKDESFDTIACLNVIEHVKSPENILKEIARVLKNGGCAIVSFPHLSYIHGEPEDYFRYTIYGFRSLCPPDLEIEAFKESAGLICFTLTPIFILLNTIFNKIPVLGTAIFYFLSVSSRIIYYIDRLFGIKKLYPVNYICALRKHSIYQ